MEKNIEGNGKSAQDPIIEGLVKFRDGKKWKSRWCVIRKLSPVADSAHMLLYRDAKDYSRGALPRASVELRHFLGCEDGFPLDKEAHTLALLCRGGAPVLALGAPEAALAWRTRAARALAPGPCSRWAGELRAPPSSALRSGPVALHVRPARFCLVAGVLPRVLAVWDLKDLRRYGVVDGGVCFEASSRCGKLGGAWLFKTDRPHALVSALDAAAPAPTKGNEDTHSQFNKRFSEISDSSRNIENIGFSPGWNLYNSQQSETASSVGFNDSASLSDITSSDRDQRGGNRQADSEKCVCCMSRLSSPTSPTANSPFGVWNNYCIDRRSDSDRASLYSQSSGATSDYSIPRGTCVAEGLLLNKSASFCGFPPHLRPKSLCPCRHSQKAFIGPYENYDVPRAPMPLIQENPRVGVSSAESNYDVPKNFKKCLLSNKCNCLKPPKVSDMDNKIVLAVLNETIKEHETCTHKTKNGDPSFAGFGDHSNYVNIEPSDKKNDNSSQPACINISDLSITLEKFGSSAEILRNAGFSQDEIDDLENMSDKDISNSCVKNIELNINENCTKKHEGYLLMHPVDHATQNNHNLTEEKPPTSRSHENSSLSKRKSSSADFLQKAEAFLDISKSTSHKDILVEINPLRKNLKYDCVNDNCDHCIKTSPNTKTCIVNNNVPTECSLSNQFKESVKIRRSCSFPSKSIKNRDSSSSNDSGVSTGSLKHHKCDFSDFETPVTDRPVCMRHRRFSFKIHRKAKSDTMQNISFQFDEAFHIPKSHSCEAGAMQFIRRDTKGFLSNEMANRRSPSSCSSEISDCLDTLSVSSISSSEICNRSTARPRSGREYSSILPVQSALRLPQQCRCYSRGELV